MGREWHSKGNFTDRKKTTNLKSKEYEWIKNGRRRKNTNTQNKLKEENDATNWVLLIQVGPYIEFRKITSSSVSIIL